MEIALKREALAEAFQMAHAIATTRTTRPVLQNALLSVADGGMTVSATDMEIGLRWNISAEDCRVVREGSVLLPAGRMAQISRSIEADEITLRVADKTCVVSGGRSVFEVLMENVEDFPQVPEMPDEAPLVLDGQKFAEMTRKTIFAVARESTRYALNGVHMEIVDGVMEMVATDGRRMALMKEKVDKQTSMPAAIVPQKALSQVEKLQSDKDETVNILTRERQVFFSTSRGTVVSRLVEGHFPPYREVVPKETDKKATISRTGLLSAMRQAAIMTSEDSRSVLLAFAGAQLTVTGRAPDEGRGEIGLDIEYEGEDLEIRFNPQFIIDALSASEAEKVTLDMKEGSSPAALKDGTGFLYVVMPINIV